MKQNVAYTQRFIDSWESQQFEHLRHTGQAKSMLESKCGSPPSISTTTDQATPTPTSDRLFHKCTDSHTLPHVPTGTLHSHRNWNHSTVYPGTCRNFDLYLPPDTQAGETLGLIFIPDGRAAWQFATNITTVLDNLIHTQRIPRVALVLSGVGWEPTTGASAMAPKTLFPTSLPGFLQRWTELDVLSSNYGSFILEELLPWIEQTHRIVFSNNPQLRCMAGQSSGGICAFNVAWTFPKQFGLIFGVSSSFCNSMSGSLLHREVRLAPKKDLRVALFVGEHDNDLATGNWCAHTKLMGDALAYKAYDSVVAVAPGGGHTLRYTASRLGEILEWLFDATNAGSGGGSATNTRNYTTTLSSGEELTRLTSRDGSKL